MPHPHETNLQFPPLAFFRLFSFDFFQSFDLSQLRLDLRFEGGFFLLVLAGVLRTAGKQAR